MTGMMVCEHHEDLSRRIDELAKSIEKLRSSIETEHGSADISRLAIAAANLPQLVDDVRELRGSVGKLWAGVAIIVGAIQIVMPILLKKFGLN